VSRRSVPEMFDLSGRVAIITGGAGLLGCKHAEAVTECGATAVLLDITEENVERAASEIGGNTLGLGIDITDDAAVESALAIILKKFQRVDILINNAANNPKMEGDERLDKPWSRMENFPIEVWNDDINVGLTGAFICARVFGAEMARAGQGVILNIASDLGIIAPDQRIYREPGKPEEEQGVKPVTYSVVKAGLIGLTRYLSTYWADKGVRANALVPGGVYNGQGDAFVERLSNLIPMGRMADKDEYKAAVAFLVSDASSYMTGANLVIDGGRIVW